MSRLLSEKNAERPSFGISDNDNKLKPEDRPAHDWYRFVLSFPPHLVREYLNRFGAGYDSLVLDPFCGTGTTIVECKKQGVPSVGIESNPMAYFASSTKIDWVADPDRLLEHATYIAKQSAEKLEKDGINDVLGDLPLFYRSDIKYDLRTLPSEALKLIIKDSISPLPLHKSLVLIDTIDEFCDEKSNKYERLAFAKAILNDISNLHFGPEVGIGNQKKDVPVIDMWMNQISAIADDLRLLSPSASCPAKTIRSDSRILDGIIKEGSIDIVFTSPPYPNEKDYTRTTRLESVLLGFVRSKSDLQTIKRNLICSNTRSVYKDDKDDLSISDFKKIQLISDSIEKRRIELGKTSGFERMYSRVTKLYFGGMARHLSNLRKILKPGARLAYVVGDQASYLQVMIRTGELLAEIAETLGYQVESIDLFRTRLATATREQLREEVVVLHWK